MFVRVRVTVRVVVRDIFRVRVRVRVWSKDLFRVRVRFYVQPLSHIAQHN